MKVAKVNVQTKTIELIELTGGEDNSGTLEDWYEHVNCNCVTHFYIYHLGLSFDLMFIMDDLGLYKEDLKSWLMPECSPVVGNALIYAIDPKTSEMIDFTDDIELLQKQITFLF